MNLCASCCTRPCVCKTYQGMVETDGQGIPLPQSAFVNHPLRPDRLDEARAEFHRWQERLDVVVRIRPLLEELQRKCPTSFHAELVLGSVAVLKAILKEG